MKVSSIMLSSLFYTTDTYSTFSTERLDEDWFEESDFDFDGFMKDLADIHADVINGVLPSGGVRSVKVIGTTSPHEYNFATDQVDLEIDVNLSELLRYLEANKQEFEQFLQDNFTSYDGFMSFTPNNLKEFYQVLKRKHDRWNDDIDRDKCIAILAGWYLSKEALTSDEYLDEMYDYVNEALYENFRQFTDKTYDEYYAYVDNFENQKDQTELALVGCGQRKQYPLDITEWYRECKEVENATA